MTEWKKEVETTVNTLQSPMIYGFESSASSVLTSQRGHWALPDATGQGPEHGVQKLQRTKKQQRAYSI